MTKKSSGYPKTLGKWGENKAQKYFEAQGFSMLFQNYYTRYGELDLILRREKELVFVEVKTRSNGSNWQGEHAINKRKLRALVSCIEQFFQERPEFSYDEWQLDLLIVEGLLNSENPQILHFQNIGGEAL